MITLGAFPRRRQVAVVVRANFNAVPASSVEFTAARGRMVRELQVGIHAVDSIWRGRWGGPVFEPPRSLSRDVPARLFVLPGALASGTQLTTSSAGDYAVIATDEDFFLSVEWEEDSVRSVPAKIAVISLAKDRSHGRPPIVLEGQRAARFLERALGASDNNPPRLVDRPFRRASKVRRTWRKGRRVITETAVLTRVSAHLTSSAGTTA